MGAFLPVEVVAHHRNGDAALLTVKARIRAAEAGQAVLVRSSRVVKIRPVEFGDAVAVVDFVHLIRTDLPDMADDVAIAAVDERVSDGVSWK